MAMPWLSRYDRQLCTIASRDDHRVHSPGRGRRRTSRPPRSGPTESRPGGKACAGGPIERTKVPHVDWSRRKRAGARPAEHDDARVPEIASEDVAPAHSRVIERDRVELGGCAAHRAREQHASAMPP